MFWLGGEFFWEVLWFYKVTAVAPRRYFSHPSFIIITYMQCATNQLMTWNKINLFPLEPGTLYQHQSIILSEVKLVISCISRHCQSYFSPLPIIFFKVFLCETNLPPPSTILHLSLFEAAPDISSIAHRYQPIYDTYILPPNITDTLSLIYMIYCPPLQLRQYCLHYITIVAHIIVTTVLTFKTGLQLTR